MTETSTRPAAIEATGLRKAYQDKSGTKTVLDAIDLHVPAGTIFSLLGPNGAGKTATVQILSTLIAADAGRVRIAGHDLAAAPHAVRAAIGVTGQFSAVDKLLTAEENLLLMADLHLKTPEGAGNRARSRVPPTPMPPPSSPRTSRGPSTEIRMRTFCGQ